MTKSMARRTFDEDIVLDAAAHVFRKRGFGGATVRELAHAAGMLPGRLLYRYPSKEALLLDLMERAINRVLQGGRSAVDAARDPVERLRLALRAPLQLLLSGEDDVYVLLYDWRSLQGPAMHALLRLRSPHEQFLGDPLQDALRA